MFLLYWHQKLSFNLYLDENNCTAITEDRSINGQLLLANWLVFLKLDTWIPQCLGIAFCILEAILFICQQEVIILQLLGHTTQPLQSSDLMVRSTLRFLKFLKNLIKLFQFRLLLLNPKSTERLARERTYFELFLNRKIFHPRKSLFLDK